MDFTKGNRFKCSFKNYFLTEFPWAEAVLSDSNSVKCSICNCTFSLSNMGRQALASHSKSKKYKSSIGVKVSTLPIIKLLQTSSLPIKEITNKCSNAINSTVKQRNSIEINSSGTTKENQITVSIENPQSISNVQDNKKISNSAIMNYVTKDDVTESEILWLLHNVSRHSSLRDIESSILVLGKMFADSAIAQKLQLSK